MLAAVLFGLAIGLAVGTLGGGGSVLAVPVLVYVLDQSVAEATTTSLAVVAGGAIAGAAGHATAGRVCWRHALSFSAAALPGIVAGTVLGESIGRSVTLLVFAVVMLAAARAIWSKGDEAEEERGWEPGAAACPPLRLPQDLVAGFAVGLLTGLLGVGGGFLIVPTLAVALAFTMRTAVGTSLAIITATSLLGLVTHLAAGRSLDAEITTAMTAGCVVGSLAGAAVASRMPQPALARAFAVLVTGVALTLVVSVAL
ncbi:MAG TPA: sulfite exporter TauE/SafE family protein [Solirubrobacteraceae bacterium]